MRRALALAVLLLAACNSTTPTTVRSKATPTPSASLAGPSPRPSAGAIALPSPTPAGVTVSPPSAAITLAGLVSAPVISDQGGSIISNNGGSLIGKTKRRLLAAPTQAPVAGAVVRLLDAAGAPLGNLTATTDAKGRYVFTTPLPPPPFVLVATLPDGRGELTAVRPAAPAARRLLEAATVDLDFTSTLASTYVLQRYVRTQADPAGTLAKFSGALEADTRSRTAAAVATGSVPVPDAFTPQQVLAAMDDLRAGNAELAAQLETVRCALVAAGQCDLGNGRAATQVALGFIKALLAEPNGGVLIGTGDARIWRLQPDGRIVTLVGKGSGQASVDLKKSLTGVRGVDAELATLQSLAFDSKGRLLILESSPALNPTLSQHRVSRLESDGTLAELWSDAAWPAGEAGWAIGSSGDKLQVVTTGGLYESSGDGNWKKALAIPPGELPTGLDANIEVAGQDARGRFYFASAYDSPVRRLDPAAGGHLETLPRGTVDGVSVDAKGQLYEVAGGKLSTRDPDGGASTPLLSVLPPDSATNGYPFNLRMFFAKGVARTPDGATYIGQQYLLYRVKDDKIALAAGSQGATSGGAADVAIQEPSGVAVAPDGALLVADSGNHRLLRVGTDQKVTVLAGSGQHFGGPRTGDALAVGFQGPYNVHVDAAGTIYLGDAGLFKLAGGQLTQLYVANGGSIGNFAVAADGTLYFCETGIPGMKLQRLAPGATTPETLAAEPDRHLGYGLALDPAGTLYLMGNGTLRTWTRAAGFATLATDARFVDGYGELATDAQGRCYFTTGFQSLTVQRYDPATKAFSVVAGTGSTHFVGSGVDQSVSSAVSPTFDAAGDLYFGDFGHRQVKRIPAAEL